MRNYFLKHALSFLLIVLGFLVALSQSPIPGPGANEIRTAVPFLLIHANPQSGGMGEIGVVASPVYNASGISLNPAILARNERTAGAQLSFTPFLRSLGIPRMYAGEFGAFFGVNGKHRLAVRSRWFHAGSNGFSNVRIRKYEFLHGIRYARSLTEIFSVGVGLNHVYSRFRDQPAWGLRIPLPDKPLNSFTGDFGFLYYDEKPFQKESQLLWSVGLNVLHIGPRVSYIRNSGGTDFMPTNLQLGAMFGIHTHHTESFLQSFEFAYQLSKLLVPTEGSSSSISAFPAMWTSFCYRPRPGGIGREENNSII